MLSPERHRHHRHPPPPQPPPPPHHPPQPSHVVATIENLPAEGGSGGGRSGISAPSSSVRQRIRKVLNRREQEEFCLLDCLLLRTSVKPKLDSTNSVCL
ncbi:hypothetical protein BTVI_108516 [Pitangus sulphuratus]|nr:hypothetical protein BTVI_108516 [Pitangus sulphuratus]